MTKEVKEWEWVTIEEDEEEEKRVNSKLEKEHVTDLVGLSRLHEESSLMHLDLRIRRGGRVGAIDEKLEKLSLETESVVSEGLWQGEVLLVHSKISFQPTEKEKVRFLFRGPGGLGIQVEVVEVEGWGWRRGVGGGEWCLCGWEEVGGGGSGW